MRTIKNIVSVLIIIIIAVTTIAFGMYTLSEQRTGGISPVCQISNQGRQFIINEFGHCEDVPELICAIEKYEIENFSYDKSYPIQIVQDFNFDEFLKEKKGVCWELSAFAKCVIGEISSIKNWDISNYIVDVRINHNFFKNHSYNYVICDGTIYAFDITCAVAQNQSWSFSFNGNSLSDIYNFAEKLNEDIYRIN